SFFFFQAEDGIRDRNVTGVQTCALPISYDKQNIKRENNMKVNKDLSIPLYQQVKDYLKDKITSCEWEVGYQLPTEKELAAQFHVSNITVKRAVLELVNKGLLHRQSGKGTFVTQV